MMKTIDFYEQSYVPYSNFPSLAVTRSKNNRYFPGCRIENMVFPLCISANQNALFCCLSEGDEPADLFTTDPDDCLISFWEKEFDISVKELNADDLPDFNFPHLHLSKDINTEDTLSKLLESAVVDQSNFPVSALIETERGYFSGVNIECSSWNMGLCAERIAIAKALTYGTKQLKKLHIHSPEGEFSSPCGACRQIIMEHMPDKQIHLHHADDTESIHFAIDLLPHSFRSSSLVKKRI
jgi:homotetrameric cytidine deaminase